MARNIYLTGGLFDKRGKPQTLKASIAKNKQKHAPEKQIQAEFFNWIFNHEKEFPILKWVFHTPNGGFRHISVAAQMQREGVRAGVSDICVPAARKGFNGLFIEMKTTVGVLSDNQKEFLEFVKNENYKTAVCRSAREAADILIEYLDLPISSKYLR